MNLNKRVALITGGAKLGQAVALALAERGCHIALTYRNSRQKAEETARRVRRLGRRAFTVPVDVTREDEVDRAVREVAAEFGRLDILVNMASVYKKHRLNDLDIDKWNEGIDTDLRAAYLFSLKSHPLMKKNRWGRIINFSDWLSRSGRPRYPEYFPYYVAKTGILGLTEMLALHLAPDILVNAIAPGPIQGPEEMTKREIEQIRQATPLKRWGGAGEIAKTVLYLIETEFVTGECIRVDGGRHLS